MHDALHNRTAGELGYLTDYLPYEDKCIYIQIVLKLVVKINDLFVHVNVIDGNFINFYF